MLAIINYIMVNGSKGRRVLGSSIVIMMEAENELIGRKKLFD